MKRRRFLQDALFGGGALVAAALLSTRNEPFFEQMLEEQAPVAASTKAPPPVDKITKAYPSDRDIDHAPMTTQATSETDCPPRLPARAVNSTGQARPFWSWLSA